MKRKVKYMKILNRIFVVFLIISILLLSGCSVRVGNSSTSSGSTDLNDSLTRDSSSSGVSSGLNESLTGLELLKNLNVTPPDSYKVTTKASGLGLSVMNTTYVKGINIRTETIAGSKSIDIYNVEDMIIYEYIEGEPTGMSFTIDALPYDSRGKGMSPMRIEELIKDVNESANLNPSGTIAKVDTLDGEKVIYIETNNNQDGGRGVLTLKIWLSAKYGIPLKMESYVNGTLYTTEAYDISTEPISDSMFEPPSTVTFTDYSNATISDDGKLIP